MFALDGEENSSQLLKCEQKAAQAKFNCQLKQYLLESAGTVSLCLVFNKVHIHQCREIFPLGSAFYFNFVLGMNNLPTTRKKNNDIYKQSKTWKPLIIAVFIQPMNVKL